MSGQNAIAPAVHVARGAGPRIPEWSAGRLPWRSGPPHLASADMSAGTAGSASIGCDKRQLGDAVFIAGNVVARSTTEAIDATGDRGRYRAGAPPAGRVIRAVVPLVRKGCRGRSAALGSRTPLFGD